MLHEAVFTVGAEVVRAAVDAGATGGMGEIHVSALAVRDALADPPGT